MALRQVGAGQTLLYARSVAIKCSHCKSRSSHSQSSFFGQGPILLHSEKLSSTIPYQIGFRRQQIPITLRICRGSVRRAALDDAPAEQNESTMQETSSTSDGLCGQLQETPKQKHGSKLNIDHPLALTVFLSLAYVSLALSFVPRQLHGPLGILYTATERLVGSNSVVRIIAYLGIVAHVLESVYARHLALKVDPDNVRRWISSTVFYGVFTLRHLISKSNTRKSD